MTFGMVLGGGGTAGVSWIAGVIAGLARAQGLDPAAAGVIVGTSAGALVGMQLRSGVSIDELEDQQRNPPRSRGGPRWSETIDRDALADIFGRWMEAHPMTEEVARAIGARATGASPRDPAEWVSRTADHHAAPSWGEQPLSITTVNIATGRRAVWTSADGVPVERCVAASTAVPGIVPPIPIEGTPHMDGGVWSTTNADLILPSDVREVLILAPQCGGGVLADTATRTVRRERALLEAEGRRVTLIQPGPAYAELGPNLMDGRLRVPAFEIGLTDGEAAPTLALEP